jgi:hypothetical protein
VIERAGVKLGVINVVSRTALAGVDAPLPVLDRQLEVWANTVDAVLVDMHGESVFEKTTLAFALVGRVAAVLGTHTHVQTHDARILPGGLAFVSDVGMTGPGGGAQGYRADSFVESMRSSGFTKPALSLADGPVELGAMLVELEAHRALSITRLS